MFDYRMPTLPPIKESVWYYPPAVKKTRKVKILKTVKDLKFVVTFKPNPIADVSISYELEPFTAVAKEYFYSEGLYHSIITKFPLPIEGKILTTEAVTSTVMNGVLTVVVPQASIT